MRIKKIRKPLFAACAVILLLAAVLAVCFSSDRLQTEFYHVGSEKVAKGQTIRVIALADLHNRTFGTDNEELIETVRKLKPDLIVIAGDMVNKDEDETDIALHLCLELQKIAPLYYGFGNHESTMTYVRGLRFDKMLGEAGIPLLINASQRLTVRDTLIEVGSTAADVDSYEKYAAPLVEQMEQSPAFTIMIEHFPMMFYEKMADIKTDLNIAGHFHGGQIVLPVVGGLISTEYGLFPKYCFGQFALSDSTLIVTRGLGNHSAVPRINNRPEITVIDINNRM